MCSCLIDCLIKSEKSEVRVLSSDSDWFGVTYQDVKPFVMEKLQKLIDKGFYPNKLWS